MHQPEMSGWSVAIAVVLLLGLALGVKACSYQVCRHVYGGDTNFCILASK